MHCKGEEAKAGNPEDKACSGMGNLPCSDSNVLLALSSNNIPAHRAVPFICAHNNRRGGQEQRCWRCCPEAERAILQETCIPGKAGWAGTCLCRCCPHSIGCQTFVKRLFFGKCWGIFVFKMFSHYCACMMVVGNGNAAGKLDVAKIPLPNKEEGVEWFAAVNIFSLYK